MAQQTAVGWLTDQIKEHKKKFGIPPTEKGYMNLIEQAKAMEKEQRIKDYNAGYTDAQCNHINDADNYANEQEYLTT
jgi:hypothetical protein